MGPAENPDHNSTRSTEYTHRLHTLEQRGIRRFVDVQLPYRWNLQRQNLGFTLDVGCGIGRNLAHLGSKGVGVDHNKDSVAEAKLRGHTAFTVEEFLASQFAAPATFDSLLASHVVEHMRMLEAHSLLAQYLPFVRSGGRVMLVCPQERGYASDSTHVQWMDFAGLQELCAGLQLVVQKQFSFPFPRSFGSHFTYNEFNVIASKP